MNHGPARIAVTLVVFHMAFVSTAIAEDQDKPDDKSFILEVQCNSVLRQEILVSEGKPFRVVTFLSDGERFQVPTREDNGRWIVAGVVERITDGVAFVKLNVGMDGRGGTSVHSTMEWKLKVDEFKGGGGGSRYLMINNLWIHRGFDQIPILVKQLSAEPERAAAAAYYLGDLRAEAKLAIPALKKAANNNNEEVKQAARKAIDKITEACRKNTKR